MESIVAFKGRDEGFTAMFSAHDLHRFGISEGDFINIIGSEGEVTVNIVGNGKQGKVYLGKECWRALGLLTPGTPVHFKKAEAKRAKEVVISVGGAFTSEEALKSSLFSEMVFEGTKMTKTVGSNVITISVEQVVPEGCALIDTQTKVIIRQKKDAKIIPEERVTSRILEKPKEEWTEEDVYAEVPKIVFDNIYGMNRIIEKLTLYVLHPLTKSEDLEQIGFKPGAVLIHGPAGSGKSSVVYALVNEAGARYVPIASHMLAKKELLQDVLEKILNAVRSSSKPTIVHIEDLERLTPQQELSFERGSTSALLKFIKDIEDMWSEKNPVVVVAETRLKANVNKAVIESSVFKEFIEIDIPNEEARREIMENKLKDFRGNFNIGNLAPMTHGYSGDDLKNLMNKAIMYATQKRLKEGDQKLFLDDGDFEEAMKDITPSALKEFAIEVPKISWDDIGGYEETKHEMQKVIEWPLIHREVYEAYVGSPPKGLLLFGPPGCGKTLFAKAVANAANASFLSVKGPELTSKYFGESEEKIREIFRKAKRASPSIIFFDEIDAIAKKRGETHEASERIVAQLLTEMDGVEQLKDTLVLAATNRIDIIDTAILRPGRFDRLVYLPTPDKEAIKAILDVKANNLPGIEEMNEAEEKEFIEEVVTVIYKEEKKRHVDTEEAITFLRTLDVRDTDDINEILSKIKVDDGNKIVASKYIGADIEAIVKEAAAIAMTKEIESGAQQRRGVSLEDFKVAIEMCPPSLPWRDFLTYEAQRVKFRRGA
jgi:SpoVK/Ycf46/Vps4 family AAA+-type ATPase